MTSIFTRTTIRSFELGLLYKDGEFVRVLEPGIHRVFDVFGRVHVDVVSTRAPWLEREDLDVILKSGALDGRVEVFDLADHERALAWVDGRFDRVLKPGLHAAFTGYRKVAVETVDAREVLLRHADLKTIVDATEYYDEEPIGLSVEEGWVVLMIVDGEHRQTLGPGAYAYWGDVGTVRMQHVDIRETTLDVAGQELMTADRVTLRLNAVVVYAVTDAPMATKGVVDYKQALYREAQLALRAVVGGRDLDALLGEKDAVASALLDGLRERARAFGVEVRSLGIRDVILPGEMKDLLNKVTEAKKAAEAAVITRREETAAMRSQANTAKLLEANPTLMRLRELEVLEKVTEKANLTVVLGGDKSLADKIVHLL